MSTPIIQIEALTCRYGDLVAVTGLNLAVEKGEIFGFLGPNGAGKTTTLRTMLDFIRPASGSIRVLGMDSRRDSVAIRRKIGYLGSELVLWENWSGERYLHWLAKMYATPGVVTEGKRLAHQLDFDLSRSLQGLSTGMKRKMGLIAALAHQPELLILDEPTIGLDPLMQKAFQNLMLEWRDAGRTVFLSSHDLKEVETICNRVAIIRQGELQTVEQVSHLTHLAFRWIDLTFNEEVQPEEFKWMEGVSEVTRQNGHLRLRVSGEANMDTLIKQVAHHSLEDIHLEHPTLEEIFLTYYGNEN